jgi:lysophospholipase L1-like esterase
MLHADAGKAPGTGGGGVGGNAAADAGRPDAGAISSGPAEVRFVGRVDRSDPAGARFAWSGTGVTARFMASSLAVKLGGGQEYTALLDGELLPKLVPGNGDTKLADNLEAGPHLIELYRRTEANQGESQFQGFVFDAAGTLLPPTLAPTRRLEVIGDSITCGFGNEGADETCGFTPQTENHYLTYGAIAARAVGAELSTIAWSGLGVVCNYGDGAQSCVDPLPTYYDRTLPQRTDSRWDFANFQPQAVIINLGTNDFSTDQDPSATDFTNAYRDFLMHVRSKYPDAWILCTCGPLLYGSELDLVRGYIADAVMATGDAKIGTFEIPSQSSADGLGCSYHPSIKTHQKMADLLIAELAARLGW